MQLRSHTRKVQSNDNKKAGSTPKHMICKTLPRPKPALKLTPAYKSPIFQRALVPVIKSPTFQPALAPAYKSPNFQQTSTPPTPPNWNYYCKNVIPTLPLQPVYKFPLQENSVQYQFLAKMIGNTSTIKIIGIEQVVNQDLWRKFKNFRRETMMNKSNDMKLISGFEPTVEEMDLINRNILNRGQKIVGTEYCDNVCLLFHCTKTNVDTVLREGLDERLGNGGIFGRGIYFSDDPCKAMGYDAHHTLIIFMVFLGDCLTVIYPGAGNNYTYSPMRTREPPKPVTQQRTGRDVSFDSIVARASMHNEYVVFNRLQCVPVFAVKYLRKPWKIPIPDKGNAFSQFRRTLPPFAWTSKGTGNPNRPCPILAQNIFEEMKPRNESLKSESVTANDGAKGMKRKGETIKSTGRKKHKKN